MRNYCAKRSFHPCCTSNSGVRASVRKIIDFYEGEQKAASLLLSTGGLSSLFSRIPKVNCSKVKLRAGICRFRGPFFSTRLELFLWQRYKTESLTSNRFLALVLIRTTWQVLIELTWSGVGRQPGSCCFGSEMCEICCWQCGRSPSLRAPAAHGVSSSLLHCKVRGQTFILQGMSGWTLHVLNSTKSSPY